jgi:hypothetical protein
VRQAVLARKSADGLVAGTKASKAASAGLRISEPNDVFEQEADDVANEVMAEHRGMMPSPLSRVTMGIPLQRKCACGGSAGTEDKYDEHKRRELALQRNPAGASESARVPPIVYEVLRSQGQPLDKETRAFFEPRFARDFSRVRVHTDAGAAQSARAVNALAYTVGREVVFAAGMYRPHSTRGRNLLAHELTHVVQQRSCGGADGELVIGKRSDKGEIEAERVAGLVGGEGSRSEYSFAEPLSFTDQTRAIVQRQALTCETKPVEDECSGAAAKCLTAAGYCSSTFPTSADLDKRLADIKANIDASPFGPNAKSNFKHFLNGSGSEVILPTALFANHKSCKEALLVQRDKFLEGTKKRLEDGRLSPGTVSSEVLRWTGHADAFTLNRSDDLAYAVGGYQLCSNVRVKATATGAIKFKVGFLKWKCQAFDCYNWDPGKGIGIPGLSDKDMCCLENAGKAKHFNQRTDPWDNLDPDSTKEDEVTAMLPGATGGGAAAPPTAGGAPSAPSPSIGERIRGFLFGR